VIELVLLLRATRGAASAAPAGGGGVPVGVLVLVLRLLLLLLVMVGVPGSAEVRIRRQAGRQGGRQGRQAEVAWVYHDESHRRLWTGDSRTSGEGEGQARLATLLSLVLVLVLVLVYTHWRPRREGEGGLEGGGRECWIGDGIWQRAVERSWRDRVGGGDELEGRGKWMCPCKRKGRAHIRCL